MEMHVSEVDTVRLYNLIGHMQMKNVYFTSSEYQNVDYLAAAI